jgi:valyl-tRNA synthetase
MEFNIEVWKTKREKGLALKDPIEIEVPKKLKAYSSDLARMHHLS